MTNHCCAIASNFSSEISLSIKPAWPPDLKADFKLKVQIKYVVLHLDILKLPELTGLS